MPSELVFVTGGTGFIGLHVLYRTLLAGNRVRAAIRTADGESRILNSLKSAGLTPKSDQLSFVVVPDITSPTAYTAPGVLDGINSIIHVASPLPKAVTDYKRDIIDPAVNGTTNILNAALAQGNIRRVVITSSGVTMLDFPTVSGPDETPLNEERKAFTVNYDNATSNPFVAYCGSKILAQRAVHDIVAKNPYGEQRSFDVATIHPGYVMGHNYFQTEYSEPALGTNNILWQTVSPTGPAKVDPTATTIVSVIDVADAHVRALTTDVPDKNKVEEFLLLTPWYQVRYDRIPAIVEQLAEDDEEVKSVFNELKFKDKVGVKIVNDVSKAEKVLGIAWRSFDDQVKDIVKQQVRLYKARN